MSEAKTISFSLTNEKPLYHILSCRKITINYSETPLQLSWFFIKSKSGISRHLHHKSHIIDSYPAVLQKKKFHLKRIFFIYILLSRDILPSESLRHGDWIFFLLKSSKGDSFSLFTFFDLGYPKSLGVRPEIVNSWAE